MIEKFRSKIIIQQSYLEVDEYGNHASSWHDYHTCRAYALDWSGNETQDAAHTSDTNQIYFTIRYCKALENINPKQYRILFGDDIYNIVQVDNKQYKHDFIKLRAKKVD